MVQHQQGVTATSQAVPASTYSNDLYSSSQRLQEQQFHLKLLPPQTNTHISYSYTISGCKGNTSNYSWRSDTCEPSSLSHMFISSSTSLDNNKMIRACQPAFPHQQDIPATTARNTPLLHQPCLIPTHSSDVPGELCLKACAVFLAVLPTSHHRSKWQLHLSSVFASK